MNNRVKEIKETIDKKSKELIILQKELEDIRFNCKHENKKVIAVDFSECKWFCSMCEDTWWD